MREHMHNFGAVTAILAALLKDDPAPITIDRAGFDSVTFILQAGAGGIVFTDANRIDFIIEHSDDGVNWIGVDPNYIVPVSRVFLGETDPFGLALRINSAHPNPTVHRLGYIDGYGGDKRFVRMRVDFVGTHGTGTQMAAVAILGHPREMPVAA